VEPARSGFGSRFGRFAAFTWLIALTTWLYDLPFLVLFAAESLPLDQVAVLGFAYKYAKDFVIYAFWPLVGLVQPVLARIRARDSAEALRDAYRSLVRIAWLVLMPAGVGLVVLSPRLIAALYPRYAVGAPLASFFVACVFAEALLHVAPLVMMTAERYRAVLLSRLFGLLSVPALLLLMPRYGMAGAALAVGVVRLLPALFATLYTSRRMGLPLPLRFGGRVLLACAAFALPLFLLLGGGPGPAFDPRQPAQLLALLPLFGLSLVGAAIFVLALRATGGLEPDDRRRLLALNLPAKALLSRLL
jgi:O-antigen/teichoic acid export membrane protein